MKKKNTPLLKKMTQMMVNLTMRMMKRGGWMSFKLCLQRNKKIWRNLFVMLSRH